MGQEHELHTISARVVLEVRLSQRGSLLTRTPTTRQLVIPYPKDIQQ